MPVPLIAAALAFVGVVILVAGLWWVAQTSRSLRDRLAPLIAPERHAQLLKPEKHGVPERVASLLGGSGLPDRLATLAIQAGYDATPSDIISLMAAFAAVGGTAAWLRTGGFAWGLLVAMIAGALPVVFLLHKRTKRLHQFETQLADGLDMITRAIRSGNALSGAIKLVGEEMPNPMGEEFRRVDEEIRLGVDPGEALSKLRSRVPTEDVRFFCTAIRIHRGTGGNLAEILDRLAEVIRERFKLLSYSRVLSVQQKWSAVLVGVSPVIFGIIFQLLNPGFFDPLISDPRGPALIFGGLVLEVIGFWVLWRIAKIKV